MEVPKEVKAVCKGFKPQAHPQAIPKRMIELIFKKKMAGEDYTKEEIETLAKKQLIAEDKIINRKGKILCDYLNTLEEEV